VTSLPGVLDAWGDERPAVVPPSGGGFGGLLRSLGGPLGKLLAPAPPPSPLDEVRYRLAVLELARLSANGVIAYKDVGDFRTILQPERQDIVFLGRRGAGKTAAACRVAQDLGRELGQKVVAMGWPEQHAQALGFEVMSGSLERQRDSVVVVDEAGLRIKPGKRDELLADAIGLARHYGLSLLWTSQSGAGVHRDVLRQDVRLAWLELEPVQVRFDREELADLLSQVVAIQQRAQPWPKGRLITRHGGEWVVGGVPLADGWSEAVSKLWRR
jgi:hypothetical protein